MGLLACEIGPAGALPLPLQRALELAVEQHRRHFDAAHRGDGGAAAAGEHVVDAEGGEAHRQDDDDAAACPGFGGLA